MSPRMPSASGSCRTCRARPRSWHLPCVPWCVAARPACRSSNDRWLSGPPGNGNLRTALLRVAFGSGLPLDSHAGCEMVFGCKKKQTLSECHKVAHNSSDLLLSSPKKTSYTWRDLCKDVQFGIPLIVSCVSDSMHVANIHTEMAHLSHDFDSGFLVSDVWHDQQMALKFMTVYDHSACGQSFSRMKTMEAAWNNYLNGKRGKIAKTRAVFFCEFHPKCQIIENSTCPETKRLDNDYIICLHPQIFPMCKIRNRIIRHRHAISVPCFGGFNQFSICFPVFHHVLWSQPHLPGDTGGSRGDCIGLGTTSRKVQICIGQNPHVLLGHHLYLEQKEFCESWTNIQDFEVEE